MISLLLVYLAIGIGLSFICSLLEAVLLSVPQSHVESLKAQGSRAGERLAEMKGDVDRPLAAILTLNTFAHTVGAAGVGAESAAIWGSGAVGIASFVVTLLILFFSEIIPKTLGAVYCRAMAPWAARVIHVLILILYPFVVVCDNMSKLLTRSSAASGFSRDEVNSIAAIALDEGAIDEEEANLIRNMVGLRSIKVSSVMTPRPVVEVMPLNATVGSVLDDRLPKFARLPLVEKSLDDATKYVHRHDLLKAIGEGNLDAPLTNFARELGGVPESANVHDVMLDFVRSRSHMALVIDEHGTVEGVITLEDCLESLLGREIVDETDGDVDMQVVARRLSKRRE